MCGAVISRQQLCQLFEDVFVARSKTWEQLLTRWVAFTKFQRRIRAYLHRQCQQASIRAQCGAKRLARGTHPKQGLHEVSASEDKMKVMAGDIYAGEIALVRAIQQVYAYDE
jgi:hypothetical protein